MLTATQVNISFGGRLVLDAVDFHARPGQLSVIIGPNGSGKTTLMRVLTGELAQTGEVRMNGLDVARAPRWKLASCRAVLAQETQMAFNLTVTEVVLLGLQTTGNIAPAEQVRRALRAVGLPQYGARLCHQLSGGERQRVHLARALVQVWSGDPALGPPWLFLDEPVSSLDLAHQLMVMRIARDFADQGGGVVAVMHDLNLSAMYADHVLLLQKGRVLAQGAPSDVLRDDLLRQAYQCDIAINTAPETGPWLLPQAVGMGACVG